MQRARQMSLFQRTNKQSRLTSPEAAGKEDCFKLYLWVRKWGERRTKSGRLTNGGSSPFSIFHLVDAIGANPTRTLNSWPTLHQPWCPDSPVTQSIVSTPSLNLGGLFNGAYVWVNGQIRLLEETADPPLFPLTLSSFPSRDWRLEEVVK